MDGGGLRTTRHSLFEKDTRNESGENPRWPSLIFRQQVEEHPIGSFFDSKFVMSRLSRGAGTAGRRACNDSKNWNPNRGDEWPSLWLARRDRLTGPRAYQHSAAVFVCFCFACFPCNPLAQVEDAAQSMTMMHQSAQDPCVC